MQNFHSFSLLKVWQLRLEKRHTHTYTYMYIRMNSMCLSLSRSHASPLHAQESQRINTCVCVGVLYIYMYIFFFAFSLVSWKSKSKFLPLTNDRFNFVGVQTLKKCTFTFHLAENAFKNQNRLIWQMQSAGTADAATAALCDVSRANASCKYAACDFCIYFCPFVWPFWRHFAFTVF